MEFHEFIRNLERKLQEPLPGIEAQQKMLPELEQADRFDQYAMNKAKPGAVLILFYPDNNSIYFPLIKRPVYEGAHSGQIALPGGKFDPADADYTSTALRETEEEIGINRSKVNILGSLTKLFIPVSNFIIYPHIGYLPEKPKMTPDRREVAEIIPAEVSAMFDPANFKRKEIKVRSQQLLAPYFDYNNYMIWGATAMILAELHVVIENNLRRRK